VIILNIENEIFKRSVVNYTKIKKYGFKKENDKYMFEKLFFNNDFKAIITIDNYGIVKGSVIDLEFNEEYLGLRSEITGEFAQEVKESYKDILIDIKNKCFESKYFIYDQTSRLNKYIKNKYNDDLETLWEKSPGYGIYRNKNNNKWYAIIMNVDMSKLDSTLSGEVEIVNIKLDMTKINDLLNEKGFYKAYHMNKDGWISIILNDTIKDEELFSLLDESYAKVDEAKIWLVPANPKYYDIVNAFNDTDEIIWKQSSKIKVNDIIYLYVANPYSKIMYKCKAVCVDIPYDYKDDNLSIDHVMKIKLLKRLDDKNYTFEYLNNLGIKSIRGPIKISKIISDKLQ